MTDLLSKQLAKLAIFLFAIALLIFSCSPYHFRRSLVAKTISSSISESTPRPTSILGPIRFPPAERLPPLDPTNATSPLSVVVSTMSADNTSWLSLLPPSIPIHLYAADSSTTKPRTASRPHASSPVPLNRGHEAMAYLTHLINHYHTLSPVTLFLHAHRYAWHNPSVLAFDAVQLVTRLNPERVRRLRYMSLRCEGSQLGGRKTCADGGIYLLDEEDGRGGGMLRQETPVLREVWGEIFPMDGMPAVLAGACCAQFAVARERVWEVPRGRFVWMRDWLLRTEMEDYFSGRIFEDTWHYIFTGEPVVCPAEHECWCDGFGVCFGEEGYEEFKKLQVQREEAEDELAQPPKESSLVDYFQKEVDGGHRSDFGRDGFLKAKIEALDRGMEEMKKEGMERAEKEGKERAEKEREKEQGVRVMV